MKKHKEFVRTLREPIVVDGYEDLEDDDFRENLDAELQAELEEKFRKLFGTLESN